MVRIILYTLSLFFSANLFAQNTVHDYDIVMDGQDYEYANRDEEWVMLKYNPTTTLNVGLQTSDGSATTVYWGDGTSTSIASVNLIGGSTSVTTKTFGSTQNGYARIKREQWDKVIGFRSTEKWAFAIKTLPAGLQYLSINNESNTIFGSGSDLPSGITHLFLTGNSIALTSTGADLPSGIIQLRLSGSSIALTSTGSDLPSGITQLQLVGSSIALTSTGADLPSNLENLYLSGNSIALTSTGSDLPSGITYLYLNGNSIALTSTGSDLPSGITYLYLNGSSIALTGTGADLPSGITHLFLIGSSIALTSTGSDLPSGITQLQLVGSSIALTSTGADLPSGITTLHLSGSSIALTIDLSSLKNIRYLYLDGSNISITYTYPTVFNSTQNYHYLRPKSGGGLTSDMVDNYLIDLSTKTWVGTNTSVLLIDLRGNNAARTSASDAAVSTLISKGVTVLTN